MKNQIENIFQQLISLPLWSIGRAGSLQWFAFGNERREIMLRDGKTKVVSDFALHVQGPWRIRQQNKIIVAFEDRLYPAGNDPLVDLPNFDWDQQGANQLDERVSRFLKENREVPLIVDRVKVEKHGDIFISLNNSYKLEVFITNTISDEHWRFFRPYSEEKHLVFTREGFRTQ